MKARDRHVRGQENRAARGDLWYYHHFLMPAAERFDIPVVRATTLDNCLTRRGLGCARQAHTAGGAEVHITKLDGCIAQSWIRNIETLYSQFWV